MNNAVTLNAMMQYTPKKILVFPNNPSYSTATQVPFIVPKVTMNHTFFTLFSFILKLLFFYIVVNCFSLSKAFSQNTPTEATITSITLQNAPSDNRYKGGAKIIIRVNFSSDRVCVPNSHRTNKLWLNFYIGNTEKKARINKTLRTTSDTFTRGDQFIDFEYTVIDTDSGAIRVKSTGVLFGCETSCSGNEPVYTGNYKALPQTPSNSDAGLCEHGPPASTQVGVNDTRSEQTFNGAMVAQGPKIVSVVASGSGTKKTGDTIDFKVTFDEYIKLDGSSPALNLKLGTTGNSVVAQYMTGSISGITDTIADFQYTVSDGDFLVTGGSLLLRSPVLSNSASIKDLADNPTSLPASLPAIGGAASFTIDGVSPRLVSVAATTPLGTYKVGQKIDFTVTFNEYIKLNGPAPALNLRLGTAGASVTASYKTGSISGTNDTDAVFTYTVIAGNSLESNASFLLRTPVLTDAASIKDLAGNPTSLPANPPAVGNGSGYTIDGGGPRLVSVATSTPAGTYKVGQKIDFTVTFNEYIKLNGPAPALNLRLGTAGASVTAPYKTGSISGTNDTDAVFTYTVVAGNSLESNASFLLRTPVLTHVTSIEDSSGNAATLPASLPAVGNGSGYTIDGRGPRLVSVATSTGTPAGDYGIGGQIDFIVTFNEPVRLKSGEPKPVLNLSLGNSDNLVTAPYKTGSISGTTDKTAIFTYTVSRGDSLDSEDEFLLETPALSNDASIEDHSGNGGVQEDTSVYITRGTGYTIDGVRPKPSAASLDETDTPAGSYKIGDKIDFIVTFNEPVRLKSGVPSPGLNVQLGHDGETVTVPYKSGSLRGAADRDAVFTYTVVEGHELTGGGSSVFTLTNQPLTHLSSIEDFFGNSATTGFLDLTGAQGYKIDGIRPRVTSVELFNDPNGSTRTDGTYLRGDRILVEIELNDNVEVSGVPELALEMNGSIKWAFYDAEQSQTTGQNSLIFSYVVNFNDMDSDGMSIPEHPLKLPRRSTITDDAGNAIATVECPSSYNSARSRCVAVEAEDRAIEHPGGHKVDGSQASLNPDGRSSGSEIFYAKVRTPGPNNPGYEDIPYFTGSYVIIDVTFFEKVEITEGGGDDCTPSTSACIHVLIGEKVIKFPYSPKHDKSNTDKVLTFSYKISHTDFDQDGFNLVANNPRVYGDIRVIGGLQTFNAEQLKLGELRTGSYDNLRVNYFPAPAGSLIDEVKVKTPSSYGTGDAAYQTGHQIIIEVTFDEPVYVAPGSIPYIFLAIGPNDNPVLRKAYYSAALDGRERDNKLTFNYILKNSDSDNDGFNVETNGRIYGSVMSVRDQSYLSNTELSFPSFSYSDQDNLRINPGLTVVPVKFNFENPQFGFTKSGVGIFSGWACPDIHSGSIVSSVKMSLNDSPARIPIPYGSLRSDTAGVCNGSVNNGFVSIFNFNILGPGEHTATLYVNGKKTGRKQRFKVITIGEEFLRDESGNGVIYLSNDMKAHLEWNQTKQGVSIIGFDEEVDPIYPLNETPSSSPTKGMLENPADGSTQTGIGVIQGWICDVKNSIVDSQTSIPGKVTIEVTDSEGEVVFGPAQAPYGSLRGDTKEVCNDDGNNGFAMIMNWNLLLLEEHAGETRLGPETFTVDIFNNGQWQDSSQVQVITMGEEFVRGVTGEGYVYLDQTGKVLKVAWDQGIQNFNIIEILDD